MAEIPVEKKSGVAWWVWLLPLLLIALLLWWILDRDDPVETAVAPIASAEAPVVDPLTTPPPVAGTVGTEPAAPAAGPITDIATITGAADATALIGRQVTLTGVPVPAMAGDRTFWVGEGDRRLFVLLPELQPGRPTEDSINVNQGQTVTVSGTLRRAQEMMSGQPIEGLPAGTEVILVADRAEVVTRAG